MRTLPPLIRRLLAPSLVLFGVACAGDPPTGSDGEGARPVSVTVSASLSADQQMQIRGLAVEVTGPGITVPVVANLTVSGATVSGTVTVPTGINRSFTVRAFDADGIETHSGTATATIRPGTNATVSIALLPLTGGAPISITIGTYTITITPYAPVIPVGATVPLTATVTDANGATVANPVIQWGSTNPVVAALSDGTGATVTLTGGVADTATVAASYRGITVSMPVEILRAVVAPLVAGQMYTCVLTSRGQAYCWGDYALGNGEVGNSTTPVGVTGGLTFTKLAGGGMHACGLTPAGAAYCWGSNGWGQLGDLTAPTDQGAPSAVADGLTFTTLAGGHEHTCGLTPAGAAYCWGRNDYGQLGNGTNMQWFHPDAVLGGLTFTSITAGQAHTCGLTVGGAAYCWGSNSSGQLGDGTTIDRLTPTAVAGGLAFTTLAAGDSHTCGRARSGATYCWGFNNHSQIGDGTTKDRHTPTAVAGEAVFTSLAAGGSHTCGLTATGAAHCWGGMFYGDPIVGSVTVQSVPTAVAPGLAFTALAAGSEHTCGLTSTGATYCWGWNVSGQLGDGTRTDRLTPTLVAFP